MDLFTTKVKTYHSRLIKDLGIKDVHGIGIWGNLGGETGGFKHLQELKPVIEGSRGGYGWQQWTGPRRRNFEAWCKTKSLNPATDEANYRFLVHETLTDEKASLAALKKTTTIKAATETWMLKNLRPGIPHLEGRLRWAQKAADALKYSEATGVADKKELTSELPIGAKPSATAGATAAGTAVVIGAAYYTPTNYLPYIAAGLAVIGVIAGIIYYVRNK